MLKWALVFFIIAVISGLLGFTGIATAAAGLAKILFWIAVAVFILFVVLAVLAGRALL